uniref:Uncharacterized protein n=1 Tax=Physcomitrium patens TaxID=3218 RepID=A0A2K1KGA3_PHYPA|nr:hypothetical protein PHYPA_009195 [Physcomitrium patens]
MWRPVSGHVGHVAHLTSSMSFCRDSVLYLRSTRAWIWFVHFDPFHHHAHTHTVPRHLNVHYILAHVMAAILSLMMYTYYHKYHFMNIIYIYIYIYI